MTNRTNDALQKLVAGIEGLLGGLTAEQSLRIDYDKSTLKEACKELRDALQNEPVES